MAGQKAQVFSVKSIFFFPFSPSHQAVIFDRILGFFGGEERQVPLRYLPNGYYRELSAKWGCAGGVVLEPISCALTSCE